MPGPMPKPAGQRRRRNAPTIPTTQLPASGHDGDIPECPYSLARAGRAWWGWAWHTPQAAAWSPGDLYSLARRAQLEDDVAALHDVHGLDFSEMERPEHVRAIVASVAALATGKLQLSKEMRELDDRYGLTAKGMAALRWEIVATQAAASAGPAPTQTRRLRAVDAAAS